MKKIVYKTANSDILNLLRFSTPTELLHLLKKQQELDLEKNNLKKISKLKVDSITRTELESLKLVFMIFINKVIKEIENSIYNKVGKKEFEKKYKHFFRTINEIEIEAFVRIILFLVGIKEEVVFVNDPRAYVERFHIIYLLSTLTISYVDELVGTAEAILCFGKFGKRKNNGFDQLLLARDTSEKYVIKTINLKFNGSNNVYLRRKSQIFEKIKTEIDILDEKVKEKEELVKILLRKRRSSLQDIGLDFLRKEKNGDLQDALIKSGLDFKTVNLILNAAIKQHQLISLLENGWTFEVTKDLQGYLVVTNDIVNYIDLVSENNSVVRIEATDLQPRISLDFIEIPSFEEKNENKNIFKKIDSLLIMRLKKRKFVYNLENKYSFIETIIKIQDVLYNIITKEGLFKDFEVLSNCETKHRLEFIGCEDELFYYYFYLEKWASRYTIRTYDEIVLNLVPTNERFSLITKISESKNIETINNIKSFTEQIFKEIIKKIENVDFTNFSLEEIKNILANNSAIAKKVTEFFKFKEGTICSNWIGHKIGEKRNMSKDTFVILENERGDLLRVSENRKSPLITCKFNFLNELIKNVDIRNFSPVLLHEPMYFKIDKKGKLFVDFGNSRMIEKREAWIKYLKEKYNLSEGKLSILKKRAGLSTAIKQGMSINGVNMLKGKEEDIALMMLIMWEYQQLWNKVGEKFAELIKEKGFSNEKKEHKMNENSRKENAKKEYEVTNQNKIRVKEGKEKREYKVKLVGEKEKKPNVQKKKVNLPEENELVKKYLKRLRKIAESEVFKAKKGEIITIIRKLKM